MSENKINTKKTNVLHGREFAISELNRFYDAMDVLPENRISSEISPSEEEEILAEIKGDEGQAEAKESFDYTRESVIKAIRRKRLVLSEGEDPTWTYELKDPVTKLDGELIFDKVTFKNRYRRHEFTKNASGIKEDDMLTYVDAKIAARINMSKSRVALLMEIDYENISAVNSLFSRVD